MQEEVNVTICGLGYFGHKKEVAIGELLNNGYYKMTNIVEDIDLHFVSKNTHYTDESGEGPLEILGNRIYVIGRVEDKQTILVNYSGRNKGLYLVNTACALANLLTIEYSTYIDSNANIDTETGDNVPEQLDVVLCGLQGYFVNKMLLPCDSKQVSKYADVLDHITAANIKDTNIKGLMQVIGSDIAVGRLLSKRLKDDLIKEDENFYNRLVELETMLSTAFNAVYTRQKINDLLYFNINNQLKMINNYLNKH